MIQYSVFGLGNSTYDEFAGMSEKCNKMLEDNGATCF